MYLYHRIDCILPASSKYCKSLACYEELAMGLLEKNQKRKKISNELHMEYSTGRRFSPSWWREATTRNKRTFAGYRTKEKRVNRGTSTFF